MGNCLVTKLKGTVNNDSLLKLGEMQITFDNPTNDSFIIINGTDGNVTIKDQLVQMEQNGYKDEVAYSGTRIDFPTYNGKYVACLSNKYNITALKKNMTGQVNLAPSGISFNLDDLKYSNNLAELGFQSYWSKFIFGGSLASLEGKPLTFLHIIGEFGGNLESVFNAQSLLAGVPVIHGDFVGGSINSLISCPKFISGDITGVNLDECANVTGSIEGFVAAAIAAGVTSKESFQFNITDTKISFGRFSTLPVSGGQYLKYENANHIRFANATQAQIEDTTRYYNIYVKGYTQEEKDALAALNNGVYNVDEVV